MESIPDIPFIVKKSPRFGRYLVAKRDLREGELILKEAPLLVYPKVAKIKENESTHKITCLSCYKLVDEDKAFKCYLCGWPFCSSACSTDSYHFKLECVVFQANEVPYSRQGAHLIYLVRCLKLKETEPHKWDKIMNLASAYDNEKNQNENALPEKAKKYVERCNLRSTLAEIEKIRNIMQINNFSSRDAHYQPGSPMQFYGAVYENGSIFPHSCAPNIRQTDRPALKEDDEPWGIWFYSLVDIAEGEILSIAYQDCYAAQGKLERRSNMYNLWGFHCMCTRCMDPTELGTFYSSLKCSHCPEGCLHPTLLPVTKLFKCDRCPRSMAVTEAEAIENNFKEKLCALSQKTGEIRRKGLAELVYNATSSCYLHPNHNLVIDATEQWLLSCDLNILLETTPESKVLYKSVILLGKKVLNFRWSFGTFLEGVKLEAVVATAIARFEFKSSQPFPTVQDEDSSRTKLAKIREIVRFIRKCIRQKESPSDPEVIPFVLEMKKYFSKAI